MFSECRFLEGNVPTLLLMLRYNCESSFRYALLLAGLDFLASDSYEKQKHFVLVDIKLEMLFCVGCRILLITFCVKTTSQNLKSDETLSLKQK